MCVCGSVIVIHTSIMCCKNTLLLSDWTKTHAKHIRVTIYLRIFNILDFVVKWRAVGKYGNSILISNNWNELQVRNKLIICSSLLWQILLFTFGEIGFGTSKSTSMRLFVSFRYKFLKFCFQYYLLIKVHGVACYLLCLRSMSG